MVGHVRVKAQVYLKEMAVNDCIIVCRLSNVDVTFNFNIRLSQKYSNGKTHCLNKITDFIRSG